MPITQGDIKLLRSLVMDDVPEGGGPPTAGVIPDAASNSIFPDISEVARAGGQVNLRKVFPAVRTGDVDGFFGVNFIVAKPPTDPRVSITLFTTGETFDTRAAAASRMEAYLARGPSYSGYLFGDHLAGQMVVTLLQRVEVPLPVTGDTFVLRKLEGQAGQFDQYVRVTKVTASTRAFADGSGDFQRQQVVLEISDVLQADFSGFDALRNDASINYTGKTKVSSTIVADAARYYGVVPLTDAAVIGDFTVKASSVYTQLVPSTRIETPIADARLNQQSAMLVKAGDSFSRTLTMVFTTAQAMYVGGSMRPGSVSVERSGVTITDKGGLLINASAAQVGLIDYANGVLTLATNVFGAAAGAHVVTYEPASKPVLVTDSLGLPVTAQSQRMSWVVTLPAPPVAGTLTVSYRALGRWYVLADDGTGAVRGADSSFGAGTLNESTSTLMLTLGALPDVNSRIILGWGSPASVVPLPPPPPPAPAPGPAPGPTSPAPLPAASGVLEVRESLASSYNFDPKTLHLAWNDGTAREATSPNGAQLEGDATGWVKYDAYGRFFDFRPNVLPPKGTAVTVSIDTVDATHAIDLTLTDEGSTWGFSLPPGTSGGAIKLQLALTIPMRRYPGTDANVQVQAGVYVEETGNIRPEWVVYGVSYPTATSFSVGSYNSATGQGHIAKNVSGFPSYQPVFKNDGGSVVQDGSENRFVNAAVGSALKGSYLGAPSPSGTQTWTFTVDLMTADVVPPAETAPAGAGASGAVVSVVSATVGTTTYQASGDTLQTGVSPSTGTGTVAGSVSGGTLTLTEWPAGQSSTLASAVGTLAPPLTVNPAAALPGSPQVTGAATLRTAISPLAVGGFNVAGTWLDGTAFSVTADAAGRISTGGVPVINADPLPPTPGTRGVFGVVDYDSGIADLRFGRRVPDSMAGQTGVVDVTALGLPGINFMLLEGVQSSTLRYNAVGYSYLPLDPAILGLNPVRLPPDGRVPIFRKGSFAVVGNTGTVAPATYANGDVIDCGRVRLSRVRLIGNDGLVIPGGYTADLDLGKVTVTSIAGWAQPVTVEHRVEDMAVVSDVQISGQISFTRPLTHDYSAPGSYVSSALVFGNIHARTSLVFDQVTWTSAWSDVPIGATATGTFNDTQNPITVTNLGALTERWAVQFTSTTAFNVMGEHLGVIATGNTATDCAPLNPTTGQPYFTIPAAGWGGGWGQGNVMRFNTVGAMAPVWVARTILQGPETVANDPFALLIRGDVDRP